MRIVAALLLISTLAPADDKLHIASKEITAPGIPGPLCVYGKNAYVVHAGGDGIGTSTELISSLRTALEEYNADANEIGNRLSTHPFFKDHDKVMTALLRHLGDYDFDQALEALDTLQKAMSND